MYVRTPHSSGCRSVTVDTVYLDGIHNPDVMRDVAPCIATGGEMIHG